MRIKEAWGGRAMIKAIYEIMKEYALCVCEREIEKLMRFLKKTAKIKLC